MAVGHALLVGVDQYDHYDPLRYCSADVNLIRRVVGRSEAFGLASGGFTILSTASGDSPTRTNIMDAVSRSIQALAPGEGLLFFFAGHGKAHRGKPYLVAQDTVPADFAKTAVAVEELLAAIRGAGVPTRVFVLDSCYSGMHRAAKRRARVDPDAFDRGLSRVFLQDEGSAVFSSATIDEVARETILDGEGHGLFTFAFAESLGEQRSSVEHGGFACVETLYARTHARTVELSRATQHPRLLYAAGTPIPLFVDVRSSEDDREDAGPQSTTDFAMRSEDVREFVELHDVARKAVVYAELVSREYCVVGIANMRDALSHLVAAMESEDDSERARLQLDMSREHLRRACVETYQTVAESSIAKYEGRLSDERKRGLFSRWRRKQADPPSKEVFDRALRLYAQGRDAKEATRLAELEQSIVSFVQCVELLES